MKFALIALIALMGCSKDGPALCTGPINGEWRSTRDGKLKLTHQCVGEINDKAFVYTFKNNMLTLDYEATTDETCSVVLSGDLLSLECTVSGEMSFKRWLPTPKP